MNDRDAHQLLRPWERATLAPANLWLPGWLPIKYQHTLGMGLMLALLALLPPQWWLLAPLFARLMALDLTAYALPDVYTLPLLAVGLTHAVQSHAMPQFIAAIVVFTLASQSGRLRLNFGGGDLKLLAALLAWLPLEQAAFALAAGCVLWLPLAFWRPKTPQPFGVPMLLGWSIILGYPHLPEALLRPMLGLS